MKTQDNTILKVVEQKEYDRYVFITYESNAIVGLNFHFGIGDLDMDFAKPCPRLTEIFNKVAKFDANKSEEQKINKAINLFCEAFIYVNDEPYTLCVEQRELIKKALEFYVQMSDKFNVNRTHEEAYEIFDMMQLAPMMNYPVQVVISEEEKANFAKHGIDFPM
jgi:hypothetical protein